MLLNFREVQQVGSGLLSGVFPDLVDGVVGSCRYLALAVLLFEHFQGPDLALVLVIAEGSHFAHVPDLQYAVDGASDYLMLVKPLATHQPTALADRPNARAFDETPALEHAVCARSDD